MAQAPKARTAPRIDDRTARESTSREARLADVAARVRDDARRSTEPFLRSTRVPGGGE